MATESGGEHAHSILHGPVNAIWDGLVSITGLEASLGHIEVPDHVAMALGVMTLCALIFIPMRRLFSVDTPGKFQQMLELLIQGLKGILDDAIGHDAGRRYLPLIGALAIFILLSNLSGLFYFLQPPTQNLNTTLALALTSFFYYHYRGIRVHGVKYFKFLLGPIPAMFLLFIPLELISHGARAVSLSLRLFGNIFGEHAVAGAFKGIAPIVLPMPVMALGVFGALLQTFIFVMLTTVYLAGAEASEH